MLICKSGNLLSTWGETSDESSVPDRKVFALCLFGVSAFGSRHFLFMECARCGTVQAAGIWILNIHFDFWSDRSWRHSACYIRQHKCLLTKSLQSEDTVTQSFASIINQPKCSIRQLRHLHQCCSEISILFYPGSPAASRMSEWERLGHTDSRCFYLYVFIGNVQIPVLFHFSPRSMWKTRICRIDL